MKKNEKLKQEKSGYENLQSGIRNLKMPEIEVWENMYSDKDYWIDMDVPEFTCICPKTGLPDFAVFNIKYQPQKYCVELKSLKYYINAYREVGIFHEHATNKILADFCRAVKPKEALITGIFNLRGGIKTTVSARYKRDK
ncbi:MAG: NADPH-dependent 7-cyano-7-deazaguanine reductase QueF [Candidatus Omnitrophica bacterium]|nr:NADPH-dependent 7-cyano-7-deazaguanine reductase QueF [Candidatus Omnitrophota bacterium]